MGHLAVWNYFQSADPEANTDFIAAFSKAKMGDERVTNDPMEAHYIGFNMWVNAVEKAGTTDVDAVRTAMYGRQSSPILPVETCHVAESLPGEPVLIGEIQADGQFDIIAKPKRYWRCMD